MRKFVSVLASCVVGSIVAAQAAEVVDQSQTVIDLSDQWSLGQSAREKYAQTFTAGITGALTALRLPIFGCSGEAVVEIRNVGADGAPGTTVLRETRIAASATPISATTLQEYRLSASVAIVSGQQYAIALRMADDDGVAFCRMLKSLPGELYPAGDGFLKKPANGPNWLALSTIGVSPFYDDLAFETVVDTGPGPGASSGDCLIPGVAGGPPIPSNAPVCRCLQDEGLREFRCALLHPDFFAIRRIPWPLPLAETYRETWQILPLTKLTAPVRIDLAGQMSKPVSLNFAGKSRQALETRSVVLKTTSHEGPATIVYGQERISVARLQPKP